MPNKTLDLHEAFTPLVVDGRKTLTQRVVDFGDFQPSHAIFNGTHEGPDFFDGQPWALFSGGNGHRRIPVPFTVGELLTIGGTNHQVRVTSIDCQRLQDTTEEQAIAGGVTAVWHREDDGYSCDIREPLNPDGSHDSPEEAFANLWRSIYPDGPKSWDANPMTWLVGFEYAGESQQTNAAETRQNEGK